MLSLTYQSKLSDSNPPCLSKKNLFTETNLLVSFYHFPFRLEAIKELPRLQMFLTKGHFAFNIYIYLKWQTSISSLCRVLSEMYLLFLFYYTIFSNFSYT